MASCSGVSKPYLLAYYPKLIRGKLEEAKPWDKLAFEIVPQGSGRFQVLFRGQPVDGAQVIVLTPGGEQKEPLASDAKGEFKVDLTASGTYGIRARHIEVKAGEYEGKKYEEARHYATLVFQNEADARAVGARPATVEFAPLPEAVSSFGAAEADGWVYVYGGHNSKTHHYSTEAVLGSFRRLNAAHPDAWEELPGGPKLQGLEIVSYKGKIYRLGGMQPRNAPGQETDNHSVSSCAVYDPAAKSWGALPDMPGGRSSHDAVVLEGKIYVIGGWQMNGKDKETDWYSDAFVLDLESKNPKWERIKQPFQRRALTAAVWKGKLYVLGGMNEDDQVELKVDIFDPATKAWQAGPPLPGPKRNGFSPAACVSGGMLYVSAADGKVHRLTEPGAAWQLVGELKQPRIVHRMVPLGDGRIVTLGGAFKGDNIALTEVINPETMRATYAPQLVQRLSAGLA